MNIHIEQGKEFVQSKEYVKAIANFVQALELKNLKQNLDEDQSEIEIFGSLGYCHLKLGDSREAISFYSRCLQSAKNGHITEWQAIACGGIGYVAIFKWFSVDFC